jgi:hypothetical protein
MAIEYSLLMEESSLSNEGLIKKIKELGYSCDVMEQLNNGVCINLSEQIGFSVYLIEAQEDSYNSWQSIYLKCNFVFRKIIIIRFDKGYHETNKRYESMIKMLLYVVKNLEKDAVLVKNGDTEECIFRGGKIIVNEKSVFCNLCNRYYSENDD